MQIHTRQAKCRRDQSASSLAVGAESLSVLVQLRVKTAGAPARKNFLESRYIDTKQICERFWIGRQGDDGADIQVAVGPSIQPMSDPRSKRIVYARMAEGALNPHRANLPVFVKEAGDSDNRIQFQERQRRGWIVQVNFAGFELLYQRFRQSICVHFQADREGGLGAYPAADTAILLARDCFMKLQRAAPESLASE